LLARFRGLRWIGYDSDRLNGTFAISRCTARSCIRGSPDRRRSRRSRLSMRVL